MLRIWGRTNSINVQKVMWTVAELGLPFERTDLGGAFGGLETEDYKSRNPNSRIPTIDDNGVIVWESNAIVRYLGARYGAGMIWPVDPAQRSEADRWMDWQQTTLTTDMVTVFWGLIRTPADKRDHAAIKAAAERMGKAFEMLNKHLAGRPFAAGDMFTMGDIPLGAFYWRYTNLDISRPALPHCDEWHQRLKERPGFRHHVMLPLS